MLIDDYINYQKTYQEKYGEKTVILMQVGSFFEAYAIDNEKEKFNTENLNQICDLMNIQISRKNKSIIEITRSNPLMAGFPLLAIEKFIQILMNNGYTVVLIEQVTEPPEPERKVTNIFSPGTSITYTPSEETSNLLSVYIETSKDLKNYKDIVFIGLSIIDLTTGKSIIYETYSESDDINKSFDEVYRFIRSHNPREIVLNVHSCPLDQKKLITYLEINNKIYHYKEGKSIDKHISKLSYQRTLLEKIFTNHGLLSVHEYLDIEKKQFGTVSYIALLQFAYEHNETVISRLEKPEIWEVNKYLILTNDSINQLNLVDNQNFNINNKFNSLFGIVNNASTAIGKRLLKDRLLNPIIDSNELNNRYNYLEELRSRNDEGVYYFKELEGCLNKIMDIERLHRRMSLKLLQPADFSSLDIAYSNIMKIMEHSYIFEGNISNILPNKDIKNEFYNFMKEYRGLFDMHEIQKYHLNNINDSFFLKGNIQEIDVLQDGIDKNKQLMYELAKKLSYFIEKDSDYIKVEHNDKEGYYLQTTKKRGEAIKKSFENMSWKIFKLKSGKEINPKEIELKFLKDRTKISSDYFQRISNKLRGLQELIKSKTIEIYLDKLEYFTEKYSSTLKKISNFVGEIDFFKSNAKTATMFGYNKPEINLLGEQSFIDAKGLRHPIIERIQTDCEYVPNDICLGLEKQDTLNGMLLYGCNAVGKSSMMKAIGLNIIMAQAGLFVASSEFIFKPFHYIFTRISDNDNIFKGQSSFAVEMSELRSILKRSNHNSIVLGDELCSGTESVSAQSIFASSVVRLSMKKVNFVFATHLHELYKLPLVQNLENVKSFHLKVIFDEDNKKLIYDRKLEEGNGPAIYGLEVCKAMDLDPDFLKLANNIRRDLLG
jgi:DNA mismatch repair protein MutS